MSEVLVYATAPRATVARKVLAAACVATGVGVRLELYGSGSLYQRLGPRHAPPLPDVVMWSGPFAAQSAVLDGLLQPYRPVSIAPNAMHDEAWHWTTLDVSVVGLVGGSATPSLADALAAPALAIADPERSEAGLSIVLAMLDRARQVDGDPEQAWNWWRQRAVNNLVLVEDDSEVVATVKDRGATVGLTLAEGSAPVVGLAALPNAVGLSASARNLDAARQLVDWLTGEAAADQLTWSPWQADRNGLQTIFGGAPVIDVEWARQQYSATRQRWASSGFGPTIKA